MVSKEEYLNYMQGSGYETSPIFQQGVERWDPESLESALLEQKFKGPLGNLQGGVGGMAGSETGLYVPEPDKGQIEREYYGPFQSDFGHEASHLGWDYNPYRKGLAEYAGGINPLGEENWNYMHDLMYGDTKKGSEYLYDFPRDKLINRGLYSLPTPVFGGQYVSGPAGRRIRKPIGFTPGGWNPNTYDKIRSSGLVDWQKGMLMQGPTTAAGQVALGQRPDQVKAQGQAYMDPNRGNVQAPTMSQQAMREEATQTGGTVNPHEATRTFSRTSQPVRGPHGYQAGGSVNPFEETRQAAQDWSPREQYISRSNQDRMHDATVNRFIQEGQGNQQRWEQGGGQGAYPVFNEPEEAIMLLCLQDGCRQKLIQR